MPMLEHEAFACPYRESFRLNISADIRESYGWTFRVSNSGQASKPWKSKHNILKPWTSMTPGSLSEGKRWLHGMVVDGFAKFQALKFTFQGLKFPVKSLVLLVRKRIPHKFQALKFQNSGPEIWRIHPPPFHATTFCLPSLDRRRTEQAKAKFHPRVGPRERP